MHKPNFHFFSIPCTQHLSYASGDLMVDASFMQTLWNMNPISSGCELAEGTKQISYFSLHAHRVINFKMQIMQLFCTKSIVLCLSFTLVEQHLKNSINPGNPQGN